MSIKLAILHEAIDRCQRMIKAKRELLFTPWLSKICKINIEFKKMLEENPGVEKRTSKEFTAKVHELAKKEEFYLKKAKEQAGLNSDVLTSEIAKLEFELQELKNELFLEEQKQKRFTE